MYKPNPSLPHATHSHFYTAHTHSTHTHEAHLSCVDACHISARLACFCTHSTNIHTHSLAVTGSHRLPVSTLHIIYLVHTHTVSVYDHTVTTNANHAYICAAHSRHSRANALITTPTPVMQTYLILRKTRSYL